MVKQPYFEPEFIKMRPPNLGQVQPIDWLKLVKV